MINMKRISAVTLMLVMLSVPVVAAEPIEGNWLSHTGNTARIAPCSNAFCITITSGKFKGRRIGTMSGTGRKYTGSITNLEQGRTYSGSALVEGGSMKLSGCVARVFCRTYRWTRR